MPDRVKPTTFSIITPSYNQGEFIEDTIKSVLSQEGDFYIEYFIMDGGSKDHSVEVIRKYDQLLKDEKWPKKCLGIKYTWVSEKDNGQTDAIEKGFINATGDIGLWLNSDDVFYDGNVFQKVARYFEEGIDLLIGNGIMMNREGVKIGDWKTDRIDLKELIFLDYHILQPSSFFKMSLYRKYPLDKSLNYAFDADFFIRILSGSLKFKKVADKFSSYRMYPEIKTRTGKEKIVKETMIIAKKATTNKLLLLICWIYKYMTFVVKNKFEKSKFVKLAFPTVRNLFYLMIVGTWGRK